MLEQEKWHKAPTAKKSWGYKQTKQRKGLLAGLHTRTVELYNEQSILILVLDQELGFLLFLLLAI